MLFDDLPRIMTTVLIEYPTKLKNNKMKIEYLYLFYAISFFIETIA